MDAVDADAVLAPFERGDARQLVHGRLGGGIGAGARTRRGHVLRADHHDPAAPRRQLEEGVAGLHDQQIGFDVDGHRLAPHVAGDVLHRLRGGEDAGIQDQHIDTTEMLCCFIYCFINLGKIREITSQTQVVLAFPQRLDRRIPVQAHYSSTALEQRFGAGLADTRGGAGDHRHLAGESGRAAGLLQLGLLQVPVFDVEGVLVGQRLPAAQRFGTQDDIDGVLVKILDDADVLGRAPERGQPELRVQRHARRRVEHGLGLFGCLGIFFKIFLVRRNEIFHISPKHRQRLGADHVIRRCRAAL